MEKEVDDAIDAVGHLASTVNSLLGRREAARLVVSSLGAMVAASIASDNFKPSGCRPCSQQASPHSGALPGSASTLMRTTVALGYSNRSHR